MADHWSNFRCRQRTEYLFNVLVRGEFFNSELRNLFSINYEHRMVKFFFDILNRLRVTHKCDRQTDGQMGGQTDFMTVARIFSGRF